MSFEEIFSLEKQLLLNDDNKFDELMDFIRRDQVRYDRNPIESIKGRVKSRDSLIRKIRKKNIPFDLESIEKNIITEETNTC